MVNDRRAELLENCVRIWSHKKELIVSLFVAHLLASLLSCRAVISVERSVVSGAAGGATVGIGGAGRGALQQQQQTIHHI